MELLFSSSNRFICIYSSDFEERSAAHVRNRKFTDWVESHTNNEWQKESDGIGGVRLHYFKEKNHYNYHD